MTVLRFSILPPPCDGCRPRSGTAPCTNGTPSASGRSHPRSPSRRLPAARPQRAQIDTDQDQHHRARCLMAMLLPPVATAMSRNAPSALRFVASPVDVRRRPGSEHVPDEEAPAGEPAPPVLAPCAGPCHRLGCPAAGAATAGEAAGVHGREAELLDETSTVSLAVMLAAATYRASWSPLAPRG